MNPTPHPLGRAFELHCREHRDWNPAPVPRYSTGDCICACALGALAGLIGGFILLSILMP